MDPLSRILSRRRFLQVSAGTAGAMTLGVNLAQRVRAQGGGFNFMTWSDHFYDEQLDAVEAATGIRPSISELAGNAEGFTRVREVGGQLDLISGDALWVPQYYEEGLIDAWDINELEVAQTLYPISREFPWWTTAEGLYLGYPFGWSPVQIYYDPAHVSPAPDSWEVLLDPKYELLPGGRGGLQAGLGQELLVALQAEGVGDVRQPVDAALPGGRGERDADVVIPVADLVGEIEQVTVVCEADGPADVGTQDVRRGLRRSGI
jgi:spermidine/putrescine-binding protein